MLLNLYIVIPKKLYILNVLVTKNKISVAYLESILKLCKEKCTFLQHLFRMPHRSTNVGLMAVKSYTFHFNDYQEIV